MSTSEQNLHNMANAAQQYCNLVETVDQLHCEEWIRQMAVVLARLHAAVATLEMEPMAGGYPAAPNFEARFELFSRIRELLGDYDGYWLEYDKVGEEACKSGSLADDFADIYFDLKAGLDWLEAHPQDTEGALALWHAGYKMHWGQHVVDASRQIYTLISAGWHRDAQGGPTGAGTGQS